jgi:hypothetical protein
VLSHPVYKTPISREKKNKSKLDVIAHICHPSKGGKLKTRELWSRPAWSKKHKPVSKITRAKGLKQ